MQFYYSTDIVLHVPSLQKSVHLILWKHFFDKLLGHIINILSVQIFEVRRVECFSLVIILWFLTMA